RDYRIGVCRLIAGKLLSWTATSDYKSSVFDNIKLAGIASACATWAVQSLGGKFFGDGHRDYRKRITKRGDNLSRISDNTGVCSLSGNCGGFLGLLDSFPPSDSRRRRQ